MNKRSLALYFKVHPVGPRDAVRLYCAYIASFLMMLLARHSFRSSGFLIPGRSKLTLRVHRIFARVVPGTNGLAILAGVHEPETDKWMDVKPGDVVVDVGAHLGRYALAAAKNAAKVIAIEPEPHNFSLLMENIKLNGFSNVLAKQLALSRSTGVQHLYLAGGGDSGTSSLEESWTWRFDPYRKRDWIEVECDTLDHLVSSMGIVRIDWLKIDVEGHELDVLEGSKTALANSQHLILEVVEGNEVSCRELVKVAGFRLVRIDPGRKEEGLRSSSNWLLVRNPS